MIEFVEVSHHYPGGKAILNSFSVRVTNGEFVALLGPSGSGKTTTLRLMAGIALPSSGVIRKGAHEVSRIPPRERRIGMVFQSLALFPNLSVAENVAFGPSQMGLASGEVLRRVDELLALLHISHLRDRAVETLSGGEAQRVALARAIAPDINLLLLDEPLSNLDRHVADVASELIRRLHFERQLTTVMVTHDRHYAMSLASRVLVLSPTGTLIEDGPPDVVYGNPQSLHSARVTGPLVEFSTTATGKRGEHMCFDICGSPLAGTWRSERKWNEQQPISVAARPESFGLAEIGLSNSFPCKVIGRGAADRRSEVACMTSDGTTFTVNFQTPDSHCRVGELIRLQVNPAAIFCFPRGDES